VQVEVDGRLLTLTSLDKVLYPGDGTTKAEVLAYYAAVAPALLRQLRDRPVTRVRWPHGTGGESFFEKNVPPGAPSWVRRVSIAGYGSRRGAEQVTYPLAADLATLTWLGNLSALELHVPQWRVDAHGVPLPPDRLVVDLDPGPPAGLAECARVALLTRQELAGLGLTVVTPVTSGSKGLQLYAAWPPGLTEVTPRDVAERIATTLAARRPTLVLASMTRSLRHGKVFLDWSQNTPAKTTISPYSLRGKGPVALAAAPRTWAEIEAGADGAPLSQLTPAQARQRLATDGDLMLAVDEPTWA
jgi:bifunctional non-homologous end joining protein LigD